MRTEKELLTILRDSLVEGDVLNISGICFEIIELVCLKKITEEELIKLNHIIQDNKPSQTQHQEFTKSECWKGGLHWWTQVYLAPQTKQIRIDFINKLITLY